MIFLIFLTFLMNYFPFKLFFKNKLNSPIMNFNFSVIGFRMVFKKRKHIYSDSENKAAAMLNGGAG